MGKGKNRQETRETRKRKGKKKIEEIGGEGKEIIKRRTIGTIISTKSIA